MSDVLYKVTGPDGSSVNGGRGVWHRPSGERPGKWMPEIAEVVPCQSGYHLTDLDHLLEWIGPRVWVAEFHPKATVVDHGDKVVGSRARLVRATAWDERSARLFAADCAERVLPIFEREHPGDDRPRLAVEAARRFARGEITGAELNAARAAAWTTARAAAGTTAWAAAWAAAGDAARAAAWAAAGDAARTAARAAAGAAAWTTARAAAWAAEQRWQTERLAAYLNGTAGD